MVQCTGIKTDQNHRTFSNAALIKSFLESDSPIASAVAHYGVYYGRMNSLFQST